ncbi:hypothetical protein [Mobiluncus curtisii]|uniref:hypothetical protein n=1 Tax=Mobiluncus curtisii TaxID=2051 RepID=UPI00146FD2FA|nr:hypothetical protein [Mobiluncus curtisii]NMW44293.1 hypothetical protein [Mobiluncus curtisii]
MAVIDVRLQLIHSHAEGKHRETTLGFLNRVVDADDDFDSVAIGDTWFDPVKGRSRLIQYPKSLQFDTSAPQELNDFVKDKLLQHVNKHGGFIPNAGGRQPKKRTLCNIEGELRTMSKAELEDYREKHNNHNPMTQVGLPPSHRTVIQTGIKDIQMVWYGGGATPLDRAELQVTVTSSQVDSKSYNYTVFTEDGLVLSCPECGDNAAYSLEPALLKLKELEEKYHNGTLNEAESRKPVKFVINT